MLAGFGSFDLVKFDGGMNTLKIGFLFSNCFGPLSRFFESFFSSPDNRINRMACWILPLGNLSLEDYK